MYGTDATEQLFFARSKSNCRKKDLNAMHKLGKFKFTATENVRNSMYLDKS